MSLGLILVSGGATYTQLPWVDSGGNRTYSNNNFTVSQTLTGTYPFVGVGSIGSGVVFTIYQATSTWASSGANGFVGFGQSSTPLAASPGFAANSIGWGMQAGSCHTTLSGTVDNAVLPSVSAVVDGDYFGFVLNMDSGWMMCFYNGDFGTQNPATGDNPAITGFSTASPLYRHARLNEAGNEITISNPVTDLFLESLGITKVGWR